VWTIFVRAIFLLRRLYTVPRGKSRPGPLFGGRRTGPFAKFVYWDLSFAKVEKPHLRDDWCELLRHELLRSDSRALMSDVAAGCFLERPASTLSAIVGFMSRLMKRPVHKPVRLVSEEQEFQLRLGYARRSRSTLQVRSITKETVRPSALEILDK